MSYDAPGAGKTVALTFDDGPGETTAALLRVLEEAHVQATFFNVGVNQAARPELVQQEAAAGFLLGNHSWGHRNMAALASEDQADEMDRTTAEQMLLVNSPPCFFRPPAGSYDANTLALAQARGMSVWNWSVDTGDWKAEGSGSAEWVERIADLAEAGADQAHPVILMHDSPGGSPATVAALPRIIQFYRDRGYTFVDLAGRSAGRLPFGYLDSARETSAGHVTVQGWAIDPDLPTQAVAVHVYVDGVGQAVVADQVRPDVGDAHPSAGPAHGFTAAFDMSPGVHRVCVFAIDTAAADDHTDLGCRNVVAPRG